MDDFMISMQMQRTTLLDSFYESSNAIAKRGPPVSRIFYTGQTKEKETAKTQVAIMHEEILKKAAGNMNKVTGFLMVYPTCILVMVEAETPHIMGLLKAFQANFATSAGHLKNVVVLCFTDEVQSRAFPAWMTVFVNASTGPYDMVMEGFPDKYNTVLSDLNINMLKWGHQLSAMDKNSQVLALESLRATAEDLLPYDPALLFSIMNSPRAPSLGDIMDLYGQTISLSFDYDILFHEKDCVCKALWKIMLIIYHH
ncbi:unnamed protein product [Calypogeia fissa]